MNSDHQVNCLCPECAERTLDGLHPGAVRTVPQDEWRCDHCAFSVPMQDLRVVECRLLPPTVLHLGNGQMHIMFPAIKRELWCGEFTPKVVRES